MKVYTIIRHKSEKPQYKLHDLIVFKKKSDAKAYLKDILKNQKEDGCTWYKDGDTYIVTEDKTGKEHTIFIEKLEVR